MSNWPHSNILVLCPKDHSAIRALTSNAYMPAFLLRQEAQVFYLRSISGPWPPRPAVSPPIQKPSAACELHTYQDLHALLAEAIHVAMCYQPEAFKNSSRPAVDVMQLISYALKY